MAINDNSTKAKQEKGSGPQQAPSPGPQADAGALIQVVQNSAGMQAVDLVKGADAMFRQIEDAATEAVVAREAQVGLRIMDKVAARLTQQAATDSLPTDATAFKGQLSQVLGAVTQSANWQEFTPQEMARRPDLFLTPGEMMQAHKRLSGV